MIVFLEGLAFLIMNGSSPAYNENPVFLVKVMVTKPVSYIVKGLRLKDFEDEQRNHLTKRASLPLPLDYRLLFSK